MNNLFLSEVPELIKNMYNIYILIGLTILLGIIAYIDFKTYKIPNKLNLALVGLRLILIPFIGMISIQNILASIVGFFFFLIPAMIIMHQMGGDIKCVAALGLFFNVKLFIVFILLSVLLSLAVHVFMKQKFKTKILPFAPFFFLAHLLFISTLFFM